MARTTSRTRATAWTGWLGFGGCMMVVIGVFNVIAGIAALVNDQVFVKGSVTSVLLDLTQWGWVHLILGAAIVAVGVGIINSSDWARLPAAVLLMVNMFSQMAFLPFYPGWSLVIIALDGVVLWAVVAHGEEI
jgi:hypothetical protein